MLVSDKEAARQMVENLLVLILVLVDVGLGR